MNDTLGANPNEGEPSKLDFEDVKYQFKRKLQNFYDRISIYKFQRWLTLILFIAFFLLRVYLTQGKLLSFIFFPLHVFRLRCGCLLTGDILLESNHVVPFTC